jgi:hypothetical protein
MSYSPLFTGFLAQGTTVASRKLQTSFVNGSGATISKGTPVSISLSGTLVPVDVSNEATAGAVMGLTSVDLPNGASGPITDAGRLENVTLSFSVGDALYIDKIGGLTNIKPTVGTNSFLSGDFVVFIGVVVKNEFNLLQKDIKLMISMVGQL